MKANTLTIVIIAFILEAGGIGLLTACLVEGASNNPAMYLGGFGGLLMVTGGFLFNKVVHFMRKK